MSLPQDFIENMKILFEKDFSSYLKSFKTPTTSGLRCNTLKTTPKELENLLNIPLEKIPWCENGFYLPDDFRAGKSPLYHAGLYYIQEPSAMSPASILEINPDDKVLDLCAAPGGKTTQLAAKLTGQGVIVSNDISASRCRPLVKNIELAGIKNAIVTSETPERLSSKFPHFFNKILIDAPCSGEGMFRKDKETMNEWNLEKPKYYSQIQIEILKSATKMLAPNGKILYSTCTFNKIENENVIDHFLEQNLNFSLIPIDHEKYGISQGFGLKDCGRLLPQRIKGEGHFVAYLQNTDTPEKMEEKEYSSKFPKPTKEQLKLLKEFTNSALNIEIEGRLEVIENTLFQIPDKICETKGLRMQKSGFCLGEFKKERFEPSQALAMGLKKFEAKNTIDFHIGDEMVTRYLKGESFEYQGENGWYLICIEGFPLGFGKMQNNRIKNKYLKSWLMN